MVLGRLVADAVAGQVGAGLLWNTHTGSHSTGGCSDPGALAIAALAERSRRAANDEVITDLKMGQAA